MRTIPFYADLWYSLHMIELLILYILTKRDFTMYAIHKGIENEFAPYTSPSFGAIKPALRRLEANGFITSRKMMSEGGKLSVFYSITKEGKSELKKLLLNELSDNPLQFLSNARVKLSCAEYLDNESKGEMFLHLKTLALKFKNDAENILNDEYAKLSFYQKIVLDNTVCEYSNLITIIEGFEKDNAGNSK